MKTYICRSELKDVLINKLLDGKSSIFGVEIITLEEWMRGVLEYEPLNNYEIYSLLKDLDLSILSKSLEDVTFLKEAIQNRYLCDFYRINPSELPIHPDYQKILQALPNLKMELLDKALGKEFEGFYVVEGYYPYYLKEHIINRMLAKGAKPYQLSEDHSEHKDYQIATQNYRQSIDKIATYIINNKCQLEDCAVICSSDQVDLIQTNFKRYNIPSYTNQPLLKSYLGPLMVAYLDFYLNPDAENYMQLVSLNALKLKQNNSLAVRLFLAKHLDEFKLEPYHGLDNEIINQWDDKYYLGLQKTYNQILEAYIPVLNDLLNCESFDEAVLYVFNLIKDDSKDILKVKRIIEKYRDNLSAAYPFYRTELLNLKLNAPKQGLLLASFNEQVFGKQELFILNPNIKNYPGFKGHEGFLNEHVLENTAFPSIELRYQAHADNAHRYWDKSLRTFYLCPGSTIDGKSNEFEERLTKLPKYQDLPTYENNQMSLVKHQLSSDSAREAFFDDHTLKGSVSSFETYFRCPYTYFLSRGLGLSTPRLTDRDPAATGTIIHKVFEVLTKKLGKDYALATNEDIEEVLAPYRAKYALLYPREHELNDAMFERIKRLIKLEMLFIESFEKNTPYETVEREYRFENVFYDDGLDKVLIRGIIDRVDQSLNFFRIIDYKTSDHTLDEKVVKQGLQLQLLTYALIYQEKTNQTPSGQFYLNITDKKTPVVSYNYTKTKGIKDKFPTEEEMADAYKKAHRLAGLVYVDDPELDLSYEHIQTGRKKNTYAEKQIDLGQTRDLVKAIYGHLLNELRNGIITCRPTDKACDYCEYHAICHFKGLKLKELPELVEGSLKKVEMEDED